MRRVGGADGLTVVAGAGRGGGSGSGEESCGWGGGVGGGGCWAKRSSGHRKTRPNTLISRVICIEDV